ncbi:MAG: NUDIX hydrolase [Candidatus Omnitrophota bacterium]|jgi:ADP-ribose pyrophosphatase
MKARSFRVRRRKVVYSKGPIHLVDCDIRMPSGKTLSRQILEHSGAVVIVPRIAKDRYLLIRQFRFAANGWIWEFPAGGVEKGETLLRAAVRELTEETSYRPRKLRKLIWFYPTPGVSAEVMHIFLAEELVPATAPKDEDEELETHEFTLAQIGRMIRSGKIIDGKTIIGYYCLAHHRLA